MNEPKIVKTFNYNDGGRDKYFKGTTGDCVTRAIAIACDLDYKSYLSYGNFKNNGIKEIWNNKTISKLRNDHLEEKRKNIVPCDRCGLEFNKWELG